MDLYPQGGLTVRPAGTAANGRSMPPPVEGPASTLPGSTYAPQATAGSVASVGSLPSRALAGWAGGEKEAEQVVTLDSVSRSFKDIYALRNITITVRRGEIFGVLGPTGGGKSTLAKLIMGFLRPDTGQVSVLGQSDPDGLVQAHARIGYLPEHPRFHPTFSGWEHLLFQARLCGLTRRNARAAAERAVETVAAQGWIRRRAGYYTPEMLHRLGIAVALVGAGPSYPELLLLDEPSSHLGRAGQAAVRDLLLECKRRGSTVVICSHRLTEVERTCDRVAILKGGRVALQTEVEKTPRIVIVAVPGESLPERLPGLMRRLKALHPMVTIAGGQSGTGPLVTSLPGSEQAAHPHDIKAAALRLLVDEGWDVISVYVERRDLESIYAQTLPPVEQAKSGILATGPLMATGPLSATPEDARPATGGLMTGPLTPLSTGPNGTDNTPYGHDALERRLTRPLEPRAPRQSGGATGNGRESAG